MTKEKDRSSRLILGTAQMGMNYGVANKSGKPDLMSSSLILDAASKAGINFIDTAVAYGDSQLKLGQLHKNRFQFSSKWLNDPVSELTKTLELLNIDSVNLWMAHKSECLLQDSSLYTAMNTQRESGKVKRIGVSVYDISEVERLQRVGMTFDVVQIPLHALQPDAKESVEKLKSSGFEIHARSIFLQGLLLALPDKVPPFFSALIPWLRQFNENIPLQRDRLHALIDFVLFDINADFVVLGAETPSQILDWAGRRNECACVDVPPPPVPLDEQILNPRLWPTT